MKNYFWDDFFKRLFADKGERKILKCVPFYCRECELLGICCDKNNK